MLGLERAGFDLTLISMRKPTDKKRHPIHDEIKARVVYLPEYLHDEPMRVFRALVGIAGKSRISSRSSSGSGRICAAMCRAIASAASARRWCWRTNGRMQAEWLHAHFIHTPASVTAYTSIMTGVPWTCSAHAKDIWTSPDWELTEKLGVGALERHLHALWVRAHAPAHQIARIRFI